MKWSSVAQGLLYAPSRQVKMMIETVYELNNEEEILT